MNIETLVLNNVELLGYVHENRFLGEKSFSLNSVKKLTIRGFVLDLLNDNGVDKIFNDVKQITRLFQNFNNIILNNVIYGNAKIKSLSVESGNWVKTTAFEAELEIIENGYSYPILNDFENFDTNFLYSDLKLRTLFDDKRFKLIKNLSESFNITRNINNKIVDGSQDIEIELDSSASLEDKDFLSRIAYQIADALFETIPTQLSEILYAQINRDNIRYLGTESFDIINGVFRFTRNFSYKAPETFESNPNLLYSFEKNHSIVLDREGIVTVTENGKIKLESNYIISDGNKIFQNPSVVLSNAFNAVTSGARQRCNNVFNHYDSLFLLNNPDILNTNPISRSSIINKNDDTLEYTIVFTNDKKIKDSFYWEYSLDISQDINKNTWNVSENGSIRSINQGINLPIVKINAALNAWNLEIKNSILNRISLLYTNVSGKNSNFLKRISTNFEKAPYQGIINYNYTYTDDQSIDMSSDIRQIKENIQDDGHINLPPIFKEYIIPNSNYTIVQNRNFKKLGTVNVNIQYSIAENNSNIDNFNSKSYISSASQKLNSVLNSYGINSNSRYLENVEFTSNEIDLELELSCSFKYVK